jgi:thiol-disulfide isomerase/thioredoxin
MKKVFTLLLALAIGFGLKAQCPLTQAVDFTATDCHGTEVHLFDILDSGQAVLIDFFFTTCGPCQQATPKVVESYYAMGCNMYDVFYMEISDRDGDAACQNWTNTYGVEYPTIGGPAGGGSICNTYQIGAFPTVILIMPNHQIVIQDLWPINNAQTIISALEQHGIQQHDCNAVTYDPQVTITVDQVLETEVTATFTPNEDCVSYAYTMATEAEIQEWMGIAGLELPEYLWMYGIPGSGTLSHNFTDLIPNTEYMIYAVPADIEGNLGEVVQVPVTTTPGGGDDIMPDFTATDINGNTIHLYDILDAGQAVLINFFLYGDEFSEAVMPDMIEAYRLYGCNAHDVFFMEISPNGHDDQCQAWVDQFDVQYPTISRDGGGNDIAQAIPVGYYPTIMLIRPDHTFANRDIYPPTLEYIINAMNAEGYEQHECPTTGELVMSNDTVYIVNEGCYIVPGEITITNMNFEAVQILEYTSDEFTIQCHEGDDPYYGNDIAGLFIAPSDSLHVYVSAYGMGENGLYIGTMRLITSIGNYEITIVYEENVGVEESHPNHCSLYPNPANDFVTLSGENLGTVRVYNALGQMVGEFEANGSELRINTTRYENGVYFVKTDETTLRFVVKH